MSRFRANGTSVTGGSAEQLRIEVTTDWRGLLNMQADALIEVLEDELGGPPPILPHQIGIAASNYRRFKRRHTRKEQCYLLADVCIDAKLATKIPDEAFTTTTSMRLPSSIPGVRIADAQQTLTISSADSDVAALLDTPLNAPICHIDRSVVDQRGRLVLISKGTYRSDVVRMDIKLNYLPPGPRRSEMSVDRSP